MATLSSKCLLICLIAWSFSATAQVHKWVDEQGRVHYGDQAPAARQSERLAIPTDSAAFPAAAPDCQTIRCQYERMRADRLREDEDRRRETIAGYDMQRRSAQSWNDLHATLAERDRIQRSEWDAFRFGPTPMDVRLQRDRVYSRPPSYGGGVIVSRPGAGTGVRPHAAPAGGSRTTQGMGVR
jgi:Domain of unknown function (DUF4124)